MVMYYVIADKQRNIFIEQFNNGCSIKEIANKNSVTWMFVYNNIRRYVEIDKSIQFTEQTKQEIVNMYQSGMSSTEIGQKFDVSHHKILKILRESNIQIRTSGKRVYGLDECYFDVIDTPNKAYILGFLYADGSNHVAKSTVSLSLQEEDRDILERIRKELKSEKSLEFLDYSTKNDFGYSYKNQYRLLCFSKHLSESLVAKGMKQNKSLLLEFPEWLDKVLYPHFIRGYIDGDGCIYRQEKVFALSITSTNRFCEKLKEIAKNIVGVNASIYDASCHNGITTVFYISGRKQVQKFLDYIYQDADMFLDRKYQVYLNKYK